jgi:transcriptional regulator GlxA family with amidase domain
MHTVAVLALDDVIAFDLATPVGTFGFALLPDGSPAYRVLVCGAPTVRAEAFTMRPDWGLDVLAGADTIVLPGRTTMDAPVPAEVVDALHAAAARGARIASICVGAFVLAATGLLDGLRATTHWLGTARLAASYPRVEVDPNVLYVDNGQFLTSAGAAAGLDMCLHLVRRDFGSAVAAEAARRSVMPLEREGGQAQFIAHDQPPVPRGAELEPLLHWLSDHTATDLTLTDIATRAGMSTRTLNRRFREQTGTTPLQWLHRERVRKAQYLLENTRHPVDRIASEVGFGSPTAFRERFKRVVGVSPNAYRTAWTTGPRPE